MSLEVKIIHTIPNDYVWMSKLREGETHFHSKHGVGAEVCGHRK